MHQNSSVKGIIKRKNYVNAAGCLVELYDDKNNDPASATLIENGSAFTNINGEYKIPYNGNVKNSLRLKFYNNEDIASSTSETVNSGFSPIVAEDETVPLVGEAPSVGELIEDSNAGKIYEVVAINGGNITKRLVYWNDEHVSGEKTLYKYIWFGGKNYQVLERRVAYNFDGKSRVCLTRLPDEPFNPVNEIIPRYAY